MRYCQLSVLSVLTIAPFCNLAKSLAPRWDDMLTKHTWNTVPRNWETLGHPSASSTIDLHFILKPHHEHALIDALYEVSVPGSPKYGAHLSIEQVAQLVAPHPDTVELINSWLEHHDVPSSSISTTRGGSWLTITGVPVSRANEMLGASYQRYRRTGTNETSILRTIGYGLPAVLHNHVQTVVPTTYFAPSHTPWQKPRSRSVGAVDVGSRKHSTGLSSRDPTDIKITPSELRSLYGTETYVPVAKDRNKLGILGLHGDYPSEDDLETFMTAYRSDGENAAYEVVQINGGEYEPEDASLEANLSVQYAEAMMFPTPLVFYSVGGRPMYEPETGEPRVGDHWFEWLKYFVNQPSVPQTLSSVYGNMEKDVPREYATTLCNMLCDLGARGVSIIFASGNFGVGHDCVERDEDGKAFLDDDGNEIVEFTPTFPGTCPCVTSVGGTTYDLEGSFMIPEVAAIESGGGFSNYFDRPDYQKEVVPLYLEKLGNKLEGYYNATSRGFPDISAQAESFVIRFGDSNYVVNGTSCSTPTVAGIISLLNDYRLFLGRRPLGFLNPWLYGKALRGINDITSGSNPGCGTDGFEATTGWDPVTGLGTPNFLILKNVIENEKPSEYGQSSQNH